MLRRCCLVVLLLLLVACQPQQAASNETILPTLAPTATRAIDFNAAHQAAVSFLDAWQRQDFASMYTQLSFNSKEATRLEDFERLYRDAQNTMTFNSLTFVPKGIGRMNERTVQMQYDVTFTTELMGQFADNGRLLTLVLDPQQGDWRVAWSTGDIFAEMGVGADLRFERSVPSRANIYDRHGEILADMNGVVVRVRAIREDVPQMPACVALLSEAMNLSTDIIEARFNSAGPNWVTDVGTIESHIYREQGERIRETCNATFERQATRRYLRGSLMPHIIGNVGYPEPDDVETLIQQGFDAETIYGQSGIERTWDEVLRGKPGGSLTLYSPTGQRLRTLASASSQIPQSIWLTVDAALQEKVIEYIGRAYAENTGESGWGNISPGASAVVMDVNTGEILSLVSWPLYDGNAFNPFPAIRRDVADDIIEDVRTSERRPQLNRPTLGAYPAGSVMKVIGATAIADSGIYDTTTRYTCTGRWTYQNDTRFDWFAPGHGTLTLRGGLKHSCNPFFYEVGFQLNVRDPMLLPTYAREMGLGAPTGIGSLAEATGTIPDPEWVRVNRGAPGWSYSDAVNMSIGQGEVEVTPLQMTRMYAAIANGGTLYRPQVVKAQGILEPTTPIADPDAMAQWDYDGRVMASVHDGLCAVTSENTGTAWHVFNLPQVSPLMNLGVCGKTGTAQNPGNDHSWFVAYAPADDPEIVVTVMLENAGEGSGVAAPITKQILEYYFFLHNQD